MIKEKIADYKWVLQQLKELYAKLEISAPLVIIIDMKKNLMTARHLELSTTQHILCF